MPPKRSDIWGTSFLLLGDNVDRTFPTYRVLTRSKVISFDCPYRVPTAFTDPSLGSDIYAQSPRGDISNVELLHFIHLLTQIVVSLSCQFSLISRREIRQEREAGRTKSSNIQRRRGDTKIIVGRGNSGLRRGIKGVPVWLLVLLILNFLVNIIFRLVESR